jgi:uncharacterized protein
MATGPTLRRRQLAGIAFACVFPSLMTWVYFVALGGREEAGIAYMVGKLLQFGFPVVWVRWVERGSLRPAAASRDGIAHGSLFGALVVVVLLALYVGGFRGSALLDGAATQLRGRLTPLGLDTPLGVIALFAFFCIAHSLLEEYYWRWFVFGRLRAQTRPALAGFISSVGFMAHHVIVLHQLTGGAWGPLVLLSLGVAIGGAAWAWIYHRSGSLYGAWWSHGLVDAGLMLVGYDLLWPLW